METHVKKHTYNLFTYLGNTKFTAYLRHAASFLFIFYKMLFDS